MWNLVYAIGRVAVVALFIQSGIGKLIAPAGLAGMLAGKGFPMATALTYLAGAVEVIGGALVAIGWQTRLAAAALAVFTIAATLIAHNFWTMTDQARAMNLIHFMKNLSIIGALLMLMAAGAGRYSADGRGTPFLDRDV